MPVGHTYIGVGRGADAGGQLDVLQVDRVLVVHVDVVGHLLLPHQHGHGNRFPGHHTCQAEAEGAATEDREADGAGRGLRLGHCVLFLVVALSRWGVMG